MVLLVHAWGLIHVPVALPTYWGAWHDSAHANESGQQGVWLLICTISHSYGDLRVFTVHMQTVSACHLKVG